MTYGQAGVHYFRSGLLANTTATPFRAPGPAPVGEPNPDVEWQGVEWFFQTWKMRAVEAAEEVRAAPTWREAKRLGNRPGFMRTGWDVGEPMETQPRLRVMRAAILAKFRQHEGARAALLATGQQTLVEESHDDRFWAAVRGDGENWTGRLLMEARRELEPAEVLPF